MKKLNGINSLVGYSVENAIYMDPYYQARHAESYRGVYEVRTQVILPVIGVKVTLVNSLLGSLVVKGGV